MAELTVTTRWRWHCDRCHRVCQCSDVVPVPEIRVRLGNEIRFTRFELDPEIKALLLGDI